MGGSREEDIQKRSYSENTGGWRHVLRGENVMCVGPQMLSQASQVQNSPILLLRIKKKGIAGYGKD